MTRLKMLSLTGAALLLAGLVFFVYAGSTAIHAQSSYGSIVGTVTDPSGAVVSGATVTVTNQGTNEKRTEKADSKGDYRFVNLAPANYKVEFSQTNYKRVVRDNVTVLVDQTTRIDGVLQVGAATETVEVTTQAPLIDTDSGTLGSQVEGKTVEEMPLNGRNVTNLIELVPGVTPQGAATGETTMNQGTHTNNAGWGNFQIGGSLSGQGSMYLDGAPLNTLFSHDIAFVPTQDAIQEFKVGTNSVAAEFGRFAGGVVEMSTKAGSNSFHGSAYEFYRTPGLNANTWNPTRALGKQQYVQDQYGGALGGPVLKDKAFFFFSFEKFHSHTASNTVTNVPDAGMVAAANPSVPGNISGNAGNLPAAQQACLTYNNVTNRTTISTACLSPTSQIFKLYFANPTNTNAVGSNNYNVFVPLGDDNRQYNTRGDINLGKNSIFVRYSNLNTSDISAQSMFDANGFQTGGSVSDYPTQQGVLGDTYTINPTTIADIRLSYTRAFSNDGPPSQGTSLAAKGFNANWVAIQAAETTDSGVTVLPKVSYSGAYNFFGFGGFNVIDNRYTNTYAINGSLTKIKGAHTIKVGGQVFLEDINGTPSVNPGSATVSNKNYAKDEWANFLLGDIDSFSYSEPIRVSPYNWYQGYYVEDTWNATRKLTINAGLRYELPGIVAERKNRDTVELPTQSATVNGTIAYGILALVNSALYPTRGVEPALHNLFSPRVGAAYRLTNDTVIRAGYALVYLPVELTGGIMATSSPVDTATTGTTNPSTSVTYTLDNPLNGVAIIKPTGTSNPNFLASYANTTPLQSVSAPVPTTTFPYMGQWNLTIGQQFKGQQSLEVGYIGALGIHLPYQGGWNQNQLSQTNAYALAQGTITSAQAQALRPHPSYLNFSDSNRWNGTVNYNAASAKYTKRFRSGLITSAYTYGKAIGDTETQAGFLDTSGSIIGVQDYNNHRGDHSLLSYSILQRSVTSYILDLPFGKGQRWLNSTNGVIDRAIGGWAINGISTFQTGQPIGVVQQSGNTLSGSWGAGTIRPDVTPGCAGLTTGSAQSRLGKWFNTTCYAKAGVFQLGSSTDPRVAYSTGDAPRVDPKLHGPGQANWDFDLQKSTRITEEHALVFRAEFFNVFNRRQFALPNASYGNAAFGTITTQQNNPRQIQMSLRFNY